MTTSGSGGGGRHWGAWGSKSTVDWQCESMEVTKDLRKNCSSVVATLNQNNADYTVRLNRESKHNRGLLRANSQVRIANRFGDVLGTHLGRVAFVVEEDEAPDPIRVRLLGAQAQVAHPGDGADVVEELRLVHSRGRVERC